MSSSHNRVLVSSRGEGNWPTTGATENVISGVESIYFPPGTGGAAPTSAEDFTNNINFSGWETKTNWIIQAQITAGTNAAIQVWAMRPTGVKELVMAVTTITLGAITASVTWGGNDTEAIVGPISHFEFECTAVSGAARVGCYVMAFNEGDIIT
jgi:hypothetical protein